MIVFNELRITRDAKNLMIDAEVRPGEYFKNVYIKGVTIDTEETYVEGGPSSNPVYSKEFKTAPTKKYLVFEADKSTSTYTYSVSVSPIKPTEKTNRGYITFISGETPITVKVSQQQNPEFGGDYRLNFQNNVLTIILTYASILDYDEVSKLEDLVNDINNLEGFSETGTTLEVGGDTIETAGITGGIITFTMENTYGKRLQLSLNEVEVLSTFSKHLFFVYIETEGSPSSDVPCGMDTDKTLGVTMYMGNYYNSLMQYMKEMSDSDCSVPQGLINQMLQWKALNLSIDSGHYLQGIKYFNKWFSGKLKAVPISKCGCNG